MTRRIRIAGLLGLMLAVAAAKSWAGDDIQMTVNGVGSPLPSVKINGNATTQGTIQLIYVVNAYSFPVGNFATFAVSMTDVHLSGPNNAVYPAPLTFTQNGSQNVILTPSPASFSIPQLGWTGSSNVVVTIPPNVPNADGTDLVGNLNVSVPGANHIGTPTTIQVHIKLVHPTACLRTYNFLTDQDFTGIVSSAVVKVKKGNVNNTSPAQFSDNVLIVNTCGSSQSLDLGIVLDSRWETHPNGSHGQGNPNAVFTYSANGDIGPTAFSLGAFGVGTPQGLGLCLPGMTIPANTTFLAAVHSQVKNQTAAALGTAPFVFNAWMLQANSACTGTPSSLALPNPAAASLPFTITVLN
jgi:hypothetical protein